jgi:hypothetical protein
VQSVLDDDAAYDSLLAGSEGVSIYGDALLAGEDFTLVAASNPLANLKATVGKMQKLADKPMECQAACRPAYAATSASAILVRADCHRLCGSSEGVYDAMRPDVAGSGIFVKGALAHPQQLLFVSSREGGERELVRRQQRELFVYANDRVEMIASTTWNPQYVTTQQLAWSEDRSQVQAVTWLELHGNKIDSAELRTPQAEKASLERDADGALAFDLQR